MLPSHSALSLHDAPPVRHISRWTRFRLWLLTEVVLQQRFDYTVLVIIAANCVVLALDQPLDDPSSRKQVFIQASDKVGSGNSGAVALWQCGV